MAVSICFGLTVSTVLCLFLVPTFYFLHAKWTGGLDEPASEQHAAREPHDFALEAAAH
jgi:hypothetical protein